MTVADYDSSPPERFVSSRAFERCGNFRTPNVPSSAASAHARNMK